MLQRPPSQEDVEDFFKRNGFPPSALISKPALDALFKKSSEEPVPEELMQEIWGESEASTKGEIYVKTVVEIIMEALSILRQRILHLKGEDGESGSIAVNEALIEQKNEELREFTEYYGEDREKINSLTRELIGLQQECKQQKMESKSFHREYYILCRLFKSPDAYYQNYLPVSTVYQRPQPQDHKEQKLLVLFHITNALILLQLLIESDRLHFITLMAYLHSIYILLVRYYHVSAVLYFILHCLASIALDITFMVFRVSGSQTIMPFFASGRTAYHTALDILLGISIAGRVVLVVLYLPYKDLFRGNRENGAKGQYFFSLLGRRIDLVPPQNS